MGLASSLSTALTGMQAAETTVDVVGNNLANSQTIGFKASEAIFATQFLQTYSVGSPPNGTGGTNPRQVGLGTRVAGITPDFTQGTVEISSVPSDLALEGDGFFIVEDALGEQLFTRNGVFRLNADNELVTLTGERVLGYGVNDEFEIVQSGLTPLSIPMGTTMVAQSTENVWLQGVLTPAGSVADTAGVVQTATLQETGGGPLTTATLLTAVEDSALGPTALFEVGTLEFTGTKGGRTLATQTFDVTATSTVQDLMTFMQEALGLQTVADDPLIPDSVNNIPTEVGTLTPGLSIVNGQIRIVSNNGEGNAIEIDPGSFRLTNTAGDVLTPSLGFGSLQEPVGETAVADFLAYDSLGGAVNVRITAVLESLTDNATTYRWFAESGNNSPVSGNDITVGTGLITFDGEGNLVSTSNNSVTVERRNMPALDPLVFDLDFSEVSGLGTASSELAAVRQDGSPPGTLTSYLIGEDGLIRGVFSSGVTRDLGQIRLARFTNPAGLVQRGSNMFSIGLNSGLPLEGDPNENGLGSIIAGAVELSNTDIGKNLIDLVLATTQYRGNARVISTAQQMLDELLNLRR
jgi:flagellar hook protein FlgE